MKETILSVVIILNFIGTAYLCVSRVNERSKSVQKISDNQLAQIDKLYSLATDFKAELENQYGKVSFPTDKDKQVASDWMQNYYMNAERVRILYIHVHETRSIDSAVQFLSFCWGGDSFLGTQGIVTDVKYPFAKYNNITGNMDPFINANFTKLDSINNEFRVLTLSLIKDIK
jgi:hypothetical protein